MQGRTSTSRCWPRATGADAGAAFEGLAPAVEDGVLVPHPRRAGQWRFSHDLVRDAVVGTIAPMSLPRLHLRLADALDAGATGRRDDAEGLAHHLWSAGPLADPGAHGCGAAAGGPLRAGQARLRRRLAAPRAAIGVARAAGLDDLELDGIALHDLVVSVRAGYVSTDDELLARGEELADRLGRRRLAAELLYARWGAASQRIQLDRSAELIARLAELAGASDDPVVAALRRARAGDRPVGPRPDRDGRAGAGPRGRAARRAGQPRRLPGRAGLRRPAAVTGVPRPGAARLGDDVDSGPRDPGRDAPPVRGDPYRTVVWAHFSANSASVAADPAWCREACEEGLAADPDNAFAFLGTMLRSEHAWAVGARARAQDAEAALARVDWSWTALMAGDGRPVRPARRR